MDARATAPEEAKEMPFLEEMREMPFLEEMASLKWHL